MSPIGQLLQGMGSTIESLSGLGEMTEEMEMFGVSATTLSQMLQSIGGEIQRLGIDHLVSATYTTPRSMQVRTRW